MTPRVDAQGVCTGCRMLADDCICPLDFDPQAAVREVTPAGPLSGGLVWPPAPPDPAPFDRSSRRDLQRLHQRLYQPLLDQAGTPPPPASRLVVVGREWCERCQADHDVYAVRAAS
jgi:hypothetical protein